MGTLDLSRDSEDGNVCRGAGGRWARVCMLALIRLEVHVCVVCYVSMCPRCSVSLCVQCVMRTCMCSCIHVYKCV